MFSDGTVELREWVEGDLAQMVRLFDEAEVAHRTPFVSPFDLAAARAHLARARNDPGRLRLAITAGDDLARGEVMLNRETGSLAYVIGAAYRGHGLALRAIELLARRRPGGLHLDIEDDNTASIAVARKAGFRPTGDAPEFVVDKGRRYALHRWSRP